MGQGWPGARGGEIWAERRKIEVWIRFWEGKRLTAGGGEKEKLGSVAGGGEGSEVSGAVIRGRNDGRGTVC